MGTYVCCLLLLLLVAAAAAGFVDVYLIACCNSNTHFHCRIILSVKLNEIQSVGSIVMIVFIIKITQV